MSFREKESSFKMLKNVIYSICDTKFAPFIKACDRLANIRYSKETGSRMFDIYKKEMKDFIEEKLPVKPEDNTDTEKTEAPKFTGKLSEQEKKMDAWHAGTRKQNVSSCSDAKLKVNYDICKSKGYDKEAAELKKEADARGLALESLSIEDIKFTLQDYIDLK